MLPSGDYSLRIGPAVTRATINKMTMQSTPTLLAVLMAIVMHWYDTASIAQWRRFMAFKEATQRRHRASTHSNRYQSDMPTLVVSYISS
jgi:heme-degrading monooxygenase HmoA